MWTLRRSHALLFLSFGITGCASVLGLDTGAPMLGDGGSETDEDGAALGTDGDGSAVIDNDAGDGGATAVDAYAGDASVARCPAGTADCNGNSADGCETHLDDPLHCGTCTTKCPLLAACVSEACCMPEHAACALDSDCCSGNCGPGGSGCKK